MFDKRVDESIASAFGYVHTTCGLPEAPPFVKGPDDPFLFRPFDKLFCAFCYGVYEIGADRVVGGAQNVGCHGEDVVFHLGFGLLLGSHDGNCSPR